MILRFLPLCLLLLLACAAEDPSPAPPDTSAQPDTVDLVALQRDFLEDQPGRWTRSRPLPEEELTEEQRQNIRRLESLGYASGSRPARARTGARVLHPERVAPGLNFYTSGHGSEAFLMDREGNVLHRWGMEFREAWPYLIINPGAKGAEHWRRARPLSDGSLLVIAEGLGIMKLDRYSNLIWARANGAHHDLEVLPNDDILVLARDGRVIPEIDPVEPILEDFILRLDAEGQEIQRVSILEAFLNSPEATAIWDHRTVRTGDVFHTNSVELLDGRSGFAAGNILVSILKLNTVAVIDPEHVRVTWLLRGDFKQQHDATLRPDGGLMLFDNLHRPGVSAVHVYDPRTGALRGLHRGTEADPFFSRTCGTSQPLPGGGLLITESDNGRAFELDAEGTLVWEFHNPHRAGAEGEYVATLFEVLRLAEDYPTAWIP